MKRLAALWLCMLAGFVHAVGVALAEGDRVPVPADAFAYGMMLETPVAAPIYELPLPLAVYRAVTRQDLGDLRVINAAGHAVPHALQRPTEDLSSEPEAVLLPLFPLYAPGDSGGDGLSLRVERNATGAIMDVRAKATPGDGVSDRIFLVDASGLSRPLQALQLDWMADRALDRMMRVNVAGSDDLEHWTPLVSAATVADLHYDGHRLTQRRIPLGAISRKYLRLSSAQPGQSLPLTTVTGWLAPPAKEPARQWLNLTGTQGDDGGGAGYQYDAGGFLPIDRAQVLLPQINSVVTVSLYSRTDGRAPWHLRHQGLVYRVRRDGEWLTDGGVSLPAYGQRFWRVQAPDLPSHTSGDEHAKPELRLGWAPHRLMFLAQGEGPFRLVYGHAAVGPSLSPVARLLEAARQQGRELTLQPAVPGQPYALAGETALQTATVPWRQGLLWTVLLVGVALLAVMARRLWRQLAVERPAP